MDITPFRVEEWMNAYEEGAKYNIAETCVDSVSLDELCELAGEDKNAFLTSFSSRRLTYGDITGSIGLPGLHKSFLYNLCNSRNNENQNSKNSDKPVHTMTCFHQRSEKFSIRASHSVKNHTKDILSCLWQAAPSKHRWNRT